MNELTYKLTMQLRPRAALIAYSSEEERMETSYFHELREIDEKGGMGEACPVTYEFMNAITHKYTQTHASVPYGAVPQNMLYADVRMGSGRYVWFNLPQRRMMYFHESLQIENAEYNIPGVIYEVQSGHLNVYAYKGEQPPAPETELCQAPFFNVSGAEVCLGSAKVEMPTHITFLQLMECWERRFWLSEFSHLGNRGNPTRSNLVLVTKAARKAPFDMQELIPMNLKLKELL